MGSHGKASAFGLKKKLTQRKSKADSELEDDPGVYKEEFDDFDHDYEGVVTL